MLSMQLSSCKGHSWQDINCVRTVHLVHHNPHAAWPVPDKITTAPHLKPLDHSDSHHQHT